MFAVHLHSFVNHHYIRILGDGLRTNSLIKFVSTIVSHEAFLFSADLTKEGVSKERIAEIIKLERRREETEVKRTSCFSCRQPGHVVADCPLKQNTSGVGACFKVQ